MPIYGNYELIHIHIPKTGGTALTELFHSSGDGKRGRDSWIGEQWVYGRWYEFQHLSMAELSALSDFEFDAFQSFAVVRNPYNRLLSDYFWRHQANANRNSWLLSFATFDAFLDAIPSDIDENWDRLIHGAGKPMANFLIHTRPQHHFISDEAGNPAVDAILRFESLDEEAAAFLSPLGLDSSKIKTPRQRTLDEFFDRGAIDTVNRLYKKDFEAFSYEML